METTPILSLRLCPGPSPQRPPLWRATSICSLLRHLCAHDCSVAKQTPTRGAINAQHSLGQLPRSCTAQLPDHQSLNYVGPGERPRRHRRDRKAARRFTAHSRPHRGVSPHTAAIPGCQVQLVVAAATALLNEQERVKTLDKCQGPRCMCWGAALTRGG